MAKRNKTRQAKRVMVPRAPRMKMDSAAMAYKRLLVDPCNAELVESPYGNEQGALINRRHFVWNNSQEAQLFVWHPVLGAFQTVVSSGNALLAPLDVQQANQRDAQRAIAGCMESMFIGAESARSGTISCGLIPGSIVWEHLDGAYGGRGTLIDLASIAGRFTNVERTPVDRCSVNWFPGGADADFIPPIFLNTNVPVRDWMARTHFCAVFVNVTGVNNVRLSFTSAVEEVSTFTSGGSAFQGGPTWGLVPSAKPKVDVAAVVRSLTVQDPSWYINTFRKVAKFGIGLAGSVAKGGLPGALGYLVESIGGGGADFGGGRGVIVKNPR